MKIHREVDGIIREFELTSQEMSEAYWEQEHKWDMNYVLELLEYMWDDDNEPMEMLKALRDDEDLRSSVAYRYRKYLDEIVTMDDERDCLKWAYEYVTRD